MKFTAISKIPNTSQMLIIPFLSMHYIYISAPPYMPSWCAHGHLYL